jgi:hypothetical protein
MRFSTIPQIFSTAVVLGNGISEFLVAPQPESRLA